MTEMQLPYDEAEGTKKKVIYVDLDEIVFRYRNKDYGAYQLRKLIVKHTSRAAILGFLLILLSILVPYYKTLFGVEDITSLLPKKKVTYAELGEAPPINEKEPPPPPPEIEPPKPPARAQVKYVPPKVVEDTKVEKLEQTIVDVDTLQKVDPGLQNVEGDPNAIEQIDFEGAEGSGQERVEVVEKVADDPDPFQFVAVEKEPQPVNMDDIKKRIGYPPAAREAGIEGTVLVRVLVDEKGNYVKHIVLQSPHPLLQKAVEKELPSLKFTPGIQAGKPIRVWVNIPFRFALL
jgi:protein TonB